MSTPANELRAEGFDVAIGAVAIALDEMSKIHLRAGDGYLAYVAIQYSAALKNVKNPYRRAE